MVGRYSIPRRPAPLPFPLPARFRMGEEDEYVKYGRRGVEKPEDPYWTPQIISQIWYQAQTGKIPVSGAGYGGPFAGPGFEGIWLDMSEIVRPTRDGIHGREYISTSIDLARVPAFLTFDQEGKLRSPLPPFVELPLPILFNPPPLGGGRVRQAVLEAARRLGTIAFLPRELGSASAWDQSVAPRFRGTLPPPLPDWLERVRLLEIEPDQVSTEWAVGWLKRIKADWPRLPVSVRIPLAPGVEDRVVALIEAGAEIVHLYAEEYGRELVPDGGSAPRTLPKALYQVHERLVELSIRDQVTLLASGGIAAAEHVPKAILCGADGVVLDFPLMIALGCGLWADSLHPCPVEADCIEPDWGAQRIVNLMAAWRDQLLEVLGAMGMREVRRLRGETGRAIFYEEEEKIFRALFSHRRPGKEPAGSGEESEGDLRWTVELLRATFIQAATGRPPSPSVEHRVGRSGGGFDRLRFVSEIDSAPGSENEGDANRKWTAEEIDLSLALNRRGDGRPQIVLPLPAYGAGMSFGSVSLQTMLARARAAQRLGLLVSTGEGGYPEALVPYADYIITQVATGLFGVREETIQRAPLVEFKYAQGAKPGLGGHLLAGKNTAVVAALREAVPATSLYSPFPFHSVYSVEDHKKHVDWIKAVNPRALISVKVATPTDVDMVAVGIYYAGAHIIHLDGGYGGTGAAPEIAKKNIAMPLEYAIPKVHHFLLGEGIRDEIVLMVSGGIRTAYDAAKSIALGADGAIIGTADLVALGCTRVGSCEKGLGCPFGIATTDPDRAQLIDPTWGTQRIVNMYLAWRQQWIELLRALGLRSMAELRGRTDLLVYLEEAEGGSEPHRAHLGIAQAVVR